jgi:hypothetical protein
MEFQERFATEAACLDYLAESRWPGGFVCPRCEGRRAWVLARRHLWECADCRQQTSVTAGTVMHGTRTALRLWFWAAYLVATHHPGISAKQLQRQLGLSRYETAWLILHKLRRAMVAPEREPLGARSRSMSSSSAALRKGKGVGASAARRRFAPSRSRFAGRAQGGFGSRSSRTHREHR